MGSCICSLLISIPQEAIGRPVCCVYFLVSFVDGVDGVTGVTCLACGILVETRCLRNPIMTQIK